jgi:hypothetical protein
VATRTGPGFGVTIDPRKLADHVRSASGPVFRQLFEDAEDVKREAQRLVGVHTPDPWGRPRDRAPGTLRDSIVKRVVNEGGRPVVQVGSEDPIAELHHEGTPPHAIAARTAPMLVFWTAGNTRVVRTPRVNHPGTRPNRYLTDALRVLADRYNPPRRIG